MPSASRKRGLPPRKGGFGLRIRLTGPWKRRWVRVGAAIIAIPIVLLSQLSRSCELRHDKRPILSDLRDSGAIEQDADLVLCLYRDDVYHADTQERGVAEVLIRKHRNGPIGDRRLRFVAQFARFEDGEST